MTWSVCYVHKFCFSSSNCQNKHLGFYCWLSIFADVSIDFNMHFNLVLESLIVIHCWCLCYPPQRRWNKGTSCWTGYTMRHGDARWRKATKNGDQDCSEITCRDSVLQTFPKVVNLHRCFSSPLVTLVLDFKACIFFTCLFQLNVQLFIKIFLFNPM